jgi:hypothetical protein
VVEGMHPEAGKLPNRHMAGFPLAAKPPRCRHSSSEYKANKKRQKTKEKRRRLKFQDCRLQRGRSHTLIKHPLLGPPPAPERASLAQAYCTSGLNVNRVRRSANS